MIYIILAKPHHKWRRTISEEMKKGAVDQNTIIYSTLGPCTIACAAQVSPFARKED